MDSDFANFQVRLRAPESPWIVVCVGYTSTPFRICTGLTFAKLSACESSLRIDFSPHSGSKNGESITSSLGCIVDPHKHGFFGKLAHGGFDVSNLHGGTERPLCHSLWAQLLLQLHHIPPAEQKSLPLLLRILDP